MDDHTVVMAMILLVGVPLLALIWTLVGRDDDRLYGQREK